MNKKQRFLVALMAISAPLTGAMAHHSFAKFDRNKKVQIVGTVKEFQFTNPHVWVELIVADPATRKTVAWSIEGLSPNNLKRVGWNRNSLKPGDKIKMTINPAISGAPGEGALIDATVNGKLLSITAY